MTDDENICPDPECGGSIMIQWNKKRQYHEKYCGTCLEYEEEVKDPRCADCNGPADSPEYKLEVDEGVCDFMCKKCIENYPKEKDVEGSIEDEDMFVRTGP